VSPRAGGLKGLWRILLFALAAAGCWVVIDGGIGQILRAGVGSKSGGSSLLASDVFAQAATLFAATAIAVRFVDRGAWSEVWLDGLAARPRLLALGFAAGALAIGVPIVALILAHWEVLRGGTPGNWAAAGARTSIFLLPAALSEELLVRGYIFAVLQQAWGWTATIIVTSVAFGALHMLNPGANAQSLSLVALAGGFLGILLWATRSLYATWMAHFAWNWTMAVGFHTAVSGVPLETPSYRYVDAGPAWVTGGAWGPEGGIAAAVGMLCVIGVLLLSRRARSE
jgi:CAAX protease family protein